jgi:hypothetical protein
MSLGLGPCSESSSLEQQTGYYSMARIESVPGSLTVLSRTLPQCQSTQCQRSTQMQQSIQASAVDWNAKVDPIHNGQWCGNK